MNSRDYENILNVMPDTGVYVIQEDNHQILYFNRQIETLYPKIRQGMVCHEVWADFCGNCPLLNRKGSQETRSVTYNPLLGGVVDISIGKIFWKDTIPAFVIMVTPRPAASTYRKLMKVHLSKDSYDILKTDSDIWLTGYDGTVFSSWLETLIRNAVIHPDDALRFTEFTRLNHLQDMLHSGAGAQVCVYRYKYSGSNYRLHMLEVIPGFDYTEDNPTAILCIRDVHDLPESSAGTPYSDISGRTDNDAPHRNSSSGQPVSEGIPFSGQGIAEEVSEDSSRLQAMQDRAYIISSLSSLFFSTYYIDLNQDTFRVVSQLSRVGDVLGDEVKCTAALQIYANNFIYTEDRDNYLKVMNIQNWLDTLRWWNPYVTVEYRKMPESPDENPEDLWVRATAVLAQTSPDDLPKTVVYVAQNITESHRQKR